MLRFISELNGQGFMAATSMKSAGNFMEPAAREMVTWESSRAGAGLRGSGGGIRGVRRGRGRRCGRR
jgi:hypothetical protein